MTLPVVQYPLAFATDVPPSFDNFVPGRNHEAVRAIRESAAGRGDRYLYLAGPAGTGKTHLLIAAARAAAGFYLDPGEPGIGPGVTESLETSRLVCLDGVGAAAGHPDWEQALFRLFNALESAGTPLVVADRSPPGRLGLELPDLASRLASGRWASPGWTNRSSGGCSFRAHTHVGRWRPTWWPASGGTCRTCSRSSTASRGSRLASGPVLGLAGLDESELGRVLVSRAHARGFELPPEVAAYLVARERRDVPHLLALLDRLDRHSLAAQRPVTIPFVRSLIEGAGNG